VDVNAPDKGHSARRHSSVSYRYSRITLAKPGATNRTMFSTSVSARWTEVVETLRSNGLQVDTHRDTGYLAVIVVHTTILAGPFGPFGFQVPLA
jgi:hypothetical protein